ncbi:MAG: flagellin [Planctomycetota bacterium]
MRISDQVRYSGLVSGYGTLLEKQTAIQRQISSGKQLDHAADNPNGFSALQRATQEQSRLTQNLSNIGQATDFSTASETALQNVIDQLQRASELGTSASDATKSPAELASISNELNTILNGVISTASQSYAGRALFSGAQTGTASFVATTDATGKITGATYQGDGTVLSTEDVPGNTIAYSLVGADATGGGFGVFQDVSSGVDIFKTLATLRDDVNSNSGAIPADLQKLTASLEHLSLAQSKVGGIQNQLSNNQSLLQDMNDGVGQMVSKLSDTDLASSITKLKDLEVAYQAALAVGAKVGDLSLLNYLR